MTNIFSSLIRVATMIRPQESQERLWPMDDAMAISEFWFGVWWRHFKNSREGGLTDWLTYLLTYLLTCSSLCLLAHKAITLERHSCLSVANLCTWLQVQPKAFPSYMISMFLLVSLFFSVHLESISWLSVTVASWPILWTCPIHCHCLHLITVDIAVVLVWQYSSCLGMMFGQNIQRIHLKHPVHVHIQLVSDGCCDLPRFCTVKKYS